MARPYGKDRDQLLAYVLSRTETVGACWIWQGGRRDGRYGCVLATALRSSPGTYPILDTHRVVYLLMVGEIPEGMHLHHTCEQALCCNPAHLEVLTPAQHKLAHHGDTCVAGHTPNWREAKQGRVCRTCDRERKRQRRRDDPDLRERENTQRRERYAAT